MDTGALMLFGNSRHVISASRRTDIPVFYAEWFMDLCRELYVDFHIRNFVRLARRLSAGTKNVIITFVKKYRHIEKMLRDKGNVSPSLQDRRILEAQFLSAASAEGISIRDCGKRDSSTNVPEGKCIDEQLIKDLFGLELSSGKDPGQPGEVAVYRVSISDGTVPAPEIH